MSQSLEAGRFFLPGPTEVHSDVLKAQAAPVISHRGPEIRALVGELQSGLQTVFHTSRPVLISTSSATGLMEAAIRNSGTGKLLCLVCGAFSERFAVIGRACGREVEVLEVPWGEGFDPDMVAARLDGGSFDAVTMVHSETSTGVLNPIRELAEVVRERGALTVVDSVSGLAGAELNTDAWELDFVLTGSQKALALPPGLSFAAWSDRMLERARSVPGRGMYFDLVRFADQLERLQTPSTPAVTLMYALRAQLERILAEGMEARWERHALMANRCHAWVGEMAARGVAMGVLAAPERRCPTVTCLTLPPGLMGPQVVNEMRERGWVIGGGYGKLKDTTIRIGHMGEHTLEGLEALLGVLGEVIDA